MERCICICIDWWLNLYQGKLYPECTSIVIANLSVIHSQNTKRWEPVIIGPCSDQYRVYTYIYILGMERSEIGIEDMFYKKIKYPSFLPSLSNNISIRLEDYQIWEESHYQIRFLVDGSKWQSYSFNQSVSCIIYIDIYPSRNRNRSAIPIYIYR